MLVTEVMCGTGGLIAAPIYYGASKRELKAVRLI
jgi:hypothetical protein